MYKISIEELKDKAYNIRRDLIELIYRAGSGHLDTSLSLVEVWLSIVHSDFYSLDAKNGEMKNRDRIFLSEGHACPVQYMINADLGYYPKEELLKGFRKPFSPFGGHTVRNLKYGFENSNGSLSIGVWQAYGNALETANNVFCIAGDGEFQEPTSQGIFSVPLNLKPLGNFTLIINRNRLAQDSEVDLGPIKEVAALYNWQTMIVKGHDFNALGSALQLAVEDKDRPTLMICDTVKGYGGDPNHAGKLGHHGKPPGNDEEYQAYLAGLEAGRRN
jgi:transketolase